MHAVRQVVVLRLEQLLLKLIELAEVLLRSTWAATYALVLINVQVVELAGRVRPHHVVRGLQLVAIRHVGREMGILLHVDEAASIVCGPRLLGATMHGHEVTARDPVSRGVGLLLCRLLLTLLVLHYDRCMSYHSYSIFQI